jgi:hypothetical protein
MHSEARMDKLAVQLERLGISSGRFRQESVSATEGAKWARIMREMSERVRELGVEQIAQENEEAAPKLQRFLRRMREVPGVSEALDAAEQARLQGVETPVEQMVRAGGGD